VKYAGLDVHKQTCHATVMDERGRIVRQERFPNKREEYRRFFSDIGKAKVAMEASYCWQPLYELLESMGYEVKLAHPMKTRIIAEAKIKTDAKDSEALAHLLRTNLLPTSYVPPKEIRELRELVWLRVCLVREQTRFKNKIRAELAKRGIEFSGSPFVKKRSQLLKELGSTTIEECLAILETIRRRIKLVSKEIERRATELKDARILMSAPGISHFSALALLAVIGDISRFPDEEKLCSYAGLVPSVHQSGPARRHGHITKQGNRMLRWVVQECLWSHLRHDTHVSRFFYRLARKKGKKVAAVAAARKLLVAVYWMLRNGEEFRAH
jgi:transposase